MAVRSAPLGGRTTDWSLLIAKIGAWFIGGSFLLVIFAINGGFSIMGTREIAYQFNGSGRTFWDMMSSITFEVPITAGMTAPAQPLFPWFGVLGTSLLQIVTIYRKLTGKAVPRWLMVLAALVSIYDLGTTFAGLAVHEWTHQTGWVVQFIIAGLLTFLFEGTVSVLLFVTIRR